MASSFTTLRGFIYVGDWHYGSACLCGAGAGCGRNSQVKAGSRWFLARVLAYDLVRGRIARVLARGLPWLEVICGLFLIAGFLLPLTVGVSFALLLVFTTAVVTAFLRDKEVDCGCFGRRTIVGKDQVRWQIAYRNLILMALLLIVVNRTNHVPPEPYKKHTP